MTTKAGLGNSNVATDLYTLKVAIPTYSPVPGIYTSAQSVTISSTSPSVTFYYTTDGTTPTTSSTLYTGPVSIPHMQLLKAIGTKSGWTTSDLQTGAYTINLFGILPWPTMSPTSGTSVNSVTVTISASNGAEIRYTTDGTDPTPSGPLYTAPLSLTSTTTLKAQAYKIDWLPSAVTTETYTIQAATPTFSPVAGTYAAGQTVTLSSTTPGATIRYTINGVDPTSNDPGLASGGTLTLGNYTLKAAARSR